MDRAALFPGLFRIHGGDGKMSVPKPILWGALLLAWAGLSLVWSMDPKQGALEMANGLALFSVFAFIALAPRDRVWSVSPILALLICGSVVALDYLYPGLDAGFGNENFKVEFCLLALPFLASVRNKTQALLALIAAVVLAGIVLGAGSNIKYLIIAALFCASMVWLARRGHWFWATALPLAVVDAAFYFDLLTKDIITSTSYRIELTTNTLAMWLASPIWGHGVGSFNYLYPEFQEAHLALFPKMGSVLSNDMGYFAGAAHNEYAQLLSDYGLIGFTLAVVLAWSLLRVTSRDVLDIAAKCVLFTAAVLSLIEFPLQNPHTAMLVAVACGILANGREAFRFPKICLIPAVPIAAAVAVVSFLSFQANQLFGVTISYIGDNPKAGMLGNFYAYQSFDWSHHIRRQLATSLNVALANDGEAVRITPDAADKLFEVAFSASGRATAVEVGRIEYLIASDRWADHAEEIEERLDWLKQRAASHHATWYVESWWAVTINDRARAEKSLSIAGSLPNASPAYREQVRFMYAALQ